MLWVQYMQYIDVINQFIKSEIRGDWMNHLAATKMMLNLYPETGHHNYAKSVRLYLRMMGNISSDYLSLVN